MVDSLVRISPYPSAHQELSNRTLGAQVMAKMALPHEIIWSGLTDCHQRNWLDTGFVKPHYPLLADGLLIRFTRRPFGFPEHTYLRVRPSDCTKHAMMRRPPSSEPSVAKISELECQKIQVAALSRRSMRTFFIQLIS